VGYVILKSRKVRRYPHRRGNYWQIKIDGVLQRDLLFSSLRAAGDQAKKLIDQERGTN
jgi:hypothetical protein